MSDNSNTSGSRPVPSAPADALQAEIAERQRRLAATVDELTTRVHPKEVLRRSASDGKDKASEAQERVREALTDEQGNPRIERIAAVSAAAAALVGALIWRRTRA